MPLPKRHVEPVYIARSQYVGSEFQEQIELETVTNTTLTNIIRQLSSLSKHSEDLFGELARDTGALAERANSLQARIDRLAIKVTQLDSTTEEISLTDIQLKKAFKSASMFDQQIFSRSTMPTAMLETYKTCDKPPPLDKLNCYRDDGKDGLKFYTDPNYFFELWRQEMLKDTERVMHDRGKKIHKPRPDGATAGGGGAGPRHKKRVRTPHNTREKQRQIAIGHGETLMPNNVIYRTPNSLMNPEDPYNNMSIYDMRPNRPNSIELRRSYPTEAVDGYPPGSPNYQQQNNYHQQQQMYDDSVYNQQALYVSQGGQPLSSDSLYAPGTPSRTKPRPSQPPPAPPSSGSGGGTPSTSNANTPTRGRSMSTGRDTLPPPPPIPEAMTQPPPPPINGGSVAAKLLGRSHSTSRSGSPQMHNTVQDQNALVMAQLNTQINNLANMGIHGVPHQISAMNDLPPPPPIPEQLQMSPKPSPPNSAPPPPPPPPPIVDGLMSPPAIGPGPIKPLTNGDVNNINAMMNMQQQNLINPTKKILPPVHDNRNDLMKAIRDGIKLRKVEKIEAKENERSTAFHDVASILARRVAIELSESESSESDDDSEGWMEPNETSA
ncbi:Wiskott-Aldrich syndrome protein family member [Sergentomyia squamirostris]